MKFLSMDFSPASRLMHYPFVLFAFRIASHSTSPEIHLCQFQLRSKR